VEADPSVMALCRELLAVIVLVLRAQDVRLVGRLRAVRLCRSLCPVRC